jgi:ABC-type transport system involved in cytochrome c biogenesis permease subunit
MTLCVNCGVELDDGLKICPLCGKDPENKEEQEHISSNYPSGIIQLQKKETRRYLWELSGIIAFSGIAACTILDLLTGKGLNWSLFSDVSITAAWVILTLYLFTYKNALAIVTLQMLTILTALFFIDLIATGREWFFLVGLPVTVVGFFAAGTVIFLYRAVHLKGLNIIASAIIALSGYCIITEIIFDKYRNGFVDLQWSLIVAVSVLPVALLFFFYHYRMKKGNRLDSFFHI